MGIITAVTGAIRVGGPSWLKAMIGRARETLASAEAELMTSTSHEVCELWNGSLVKVKGTAPIQELLFFEPDHTLPPPHDTAEFDGVFRIFTLEEALAKYPDLLKKREPQAPWLMRMLSRWKHAKHDEEASNLPYRKEGFQNKSLMAGSSSSLSPAIKSAPNVSLNLNPPKRSGERYSLAVLGVIIQLAVLAIDGLVMYYWKWLKGGLPVQTYAYPLTVVGTVFLVFGMFICAGVINKSTTKVTWVRGPAGEKLKIRILYLQRGGVINGQRFESCAIIAKQARDNISTSRRRGYASVPSTVASATLTSGGRRNTEIEKHGFKFDKFGTITLVGAFISVGGFCIQFMGLRSLHWSASVGQLVATFIMTAVRTFERRDLVGRPHEEPLSEGHEMDWLASRMTKDRTKFWTYYSDIQRHDMSVLHEFMSGENPAWRWSIYTGDNARARWTQPPQIATTLSDAQKHIKIRQRLGELCRWTSPVSELAVAVASSIDEVMNAVFSQVKMRQFVWSLNAKVGNKSQWINLTIERESYRKQWVSNAAEIEAVLSVWLFHVREMERSQFLIRQMGRERHLSKLGISAVVDDWLRCGEPAMQRHNIQFLGPDSPSLRRDLHWWVPSRASTLLEVWDLTPVDNFKVPALDTSADGICIIDYHRVTGFAKFASSRDEARREPVALEYKSQELALDTFCEDLPIADDHIHLKRNGKSSLARVSETKLEVSLAQHLFSGFMWAVSEHLMNVDGQTTTQQTNSSDNPTDWQSIKLDNSLLSRIAQAIHNTGLGSLEDVYLSIIPPLSHTNLLPIGAAVDPILRNLKARKANNDWEKSGSILLELLHFGTTFGSLTNSRKIPCQFSLKATAVALEFNRSLLETTSIWTDQLRDPDTLVRLQNLLAERFALIDKEVFSNLGMVYRRQNRLEGLGGLIKNIPDDTATFPAYLGYTPLHESVFKNAEVHEAEKKCVNRRDVLGWSPLHYAVNSDGFTVSLLLKDGADPNARDIVDWTPLHYAAFHKKPALAETLLAKGADLNVHTWSGLTPLHCAVRGGHFGVVFKLINRKARVDIRDNALMTPLHWAAYLGMSSIVSLLLENRASPKEQDDHGRTPLHLAAIGAGVDTLRVLAEVSDGAAKDNDGKTAVDLAVYKGNEESMKFLLERSDIKDSCTLEKIHDALRLAANHGRASIMRILLNMSAVDQDDADKKGHTALMHAARNGHTDVVQLLLDNHADTDAKDVGNSRTACHLAAKHGHLDIVRLLISHKSTPDKNGNHPIALAAEHGFEGVVRFLLQHGAPVPGRDHAAINSTRTALHLAAYSNHRPCVQLLLDAGADVNARDQYYQTPLCGAAQYGHASVAHLLLTHGAMANLAGDYNQTPLGWAAEKGHADIVQILLDHGAEVNVVDRGGMTPLHSACAGAFEDVIRIILEAGANPEITDSMGRTASMVLGIDIDKFPQKGGNSIDTIKWMLQEYGSLNAGNASCAGSVINTGTSSVSVSGIGIGSGNGGWSGEIPDRLSQLGFL